MSLPLPLPLLVAPPCWQERLFIFAATWSIGGVLEAVDRPRWDTIIRRIASDAAMPITLTGSRASADISVFDFYTDLKAPG